MIRFEQVGKRYPNGHVGLHELSFRVRRGEFLFVTGHSGAGKSTLLRLLLVRLEDDRYRLIWTYHHILMDGWSVSRLIGEVLRHYSGDAQEPVAA